MPMITPSRPRSSVSDPHPVAEHGLWGVPSDDPIAQRIAAAVTQGRLPIGHKLGEEALCRAFGVSRTLIRQALQRLAFTGVVTLVPNRGAFVATPSIERAHDAYAARRLIEAEIVADAARHCTAHDIRALRRHVDRQAAAEASGDRSAFVKLLGEFHLVLAAIGGNRVLEGFVAQLVAQTSLMLAFYETSDSPSCAVEDHARLIDLMAAGDAEGCVACMQQHLQLNEDRLIPAKRNAGEVDLKAALFPDGG